MTAPFVTAPGPTLGPDRRLVYIAGYGRSGSTVLDIALSCHPRLEGLGELAAVFGAVAGHATAERTAVEHRVATAARLAIGGPAPSTGAGAAGSDDRRLLAADRLVRRLERLLPGPWPWPHQRTRYRELQTHLLCQLFDETGADGLVDSSKTSWLRTWRLALLAPVVPRTDCIVLVRGLPDVVASVRRGHGETLEHQRLPTSRAVLGWAVATASAVVVGRLVCGPDRTRLVRHDRFVADPGGQLAAIFDWLDLDPAPAAIAAGLTNGFEPRHQLVGNRVRSTGRIEVRRPAGPPARLPVLTRAVVVAVAKLVDLVVLRHVQPITPPAVTARPDDDADLDPPGPVPTERRSA